MITIDYFSDILCVWAYGGQIRLDELQREFADDVLVRHHFIPLFADSHTRITESWQDQGGFDGFASHLHEVCAQWDHVALHTAVWRRCRPVSSTTAHAFLKAVELGFQAIDDDADDRLRTRFERLIAETRGAFFEQAQDVASLPLLLDTLTPRDLPTDAVLAAIQDGRAYAALHRDRELMKSYGVQGSPTYVFNEGRQLLYGNVGYRIIESNVRELLSSRHVDGEPSWC